MTTVKYRKLIFFTILIISISIFCIFKFRGYYLEYKITNSQKYIDKKNKIKNLLSNNYDEIWFGDSILEDFCSTNSQHLNAGIGGETTRSLLKRLKFYDNFYSKKITVLIGINDILFNQNVSSSIINIEELIKLLVTKTDKLVIISLLPVNFEKAFFVDNKKSNLNILKLNSKIKDICNEMESNDCCIIEFKEIHNLFLTKNVLNNELTPDGVHLNETGYKLLIKNLQ